MTINDLRDAFRQDRALYSVHARREMREDERGLVSDREVGEAIDSGEVIENYPDDRPYPSALVFGRSSAGRPLHVVAAYDAADRMVVIVTVYEPDPDRWVGFKGRRTP